MASLPRLDLLEEVMDFLASGPSSEEIIAYKISDEQQRHVADLLERNRQGVLSEAERLEMDEIGRFNRFMIALKAKAKLKLAKK
jgi:hypothetical protein